MWVHVAHALSDMRVFLIIYGVKSDSYGVAGRISRLAAVDALEIWWVAGTSRLRQAVST